MKHIVSFSGGRTSAYLVYLMKRISQNNKDFDVDYIFMDTGAEHPKTYEFVRDLIRNFNINLICLQADVNPELGEGIRHKVVNSEDLKWDLHLFKKILKKHGNFTVNRPYCTARLKTQVFDDYCKNTYGKGNFQTWIGIRADEPKRLPKAITEDSTKHQINKSKLKYLAQISDFTKEDITDWWAEQSFDLGIAGDQHLGNCIFCIKKGANKIALAARDEPEKFKEWNSMVNDHENVRPMPADKFGIGHIYRQWASPEKIIEMFSDHTDDDLRQRIYKTKQSDSECSESCEINFNQLDMFNELDNEKVINNEP